MAGKKFAIKGLRMKKILFCCCISALIISCLVPPWQRTYSSRNAKHYSPTDYGWIWMPPENASSIDTVRLSVQTGLLLFIAGCTVFFHKLFPARIKKQRSISSFRRQFLRNKKWAFIRKVFFYPAFGLVVFCTIGLFIQNIMDWNKLSDCEKQIEVLKTELAQQTQTTGKGSAYLCSLTSGDTPEATEPSPRLTRLRAFRDNGTMPHVAGNEAVEDKNTYLDNLIAGKQTTASRSQLLNDLLLVAPVEKVNSVYDGDTFRCDLKYPPAIGYKDIPIRIRGVDCPEIRGGTEEQKSSARQSQQFTEKLLSSSHEIILKNIARDKYFRILADVEIDGQDLGKLLLENNLAQLYNPN